VVHFQYTGDGQNTGNTIQYRNKTVLAALNEHYLHFRCSFVCLCCVVPVSLSCRLCFVTFRIQVTCQIFKEDKLLAHV